MGLRGLFYGELHPCQSDIALGAKSDLLIQNNATSCLHRSTVLVWKVRYVAVSSRALPAPHSALETNLMGSLRYLTVSLTLGDGHKATFVPPPGQIAQLHVVALCSKLTRF